jgi:hypothetical protein
MEASPSNLGGTKEISSLRRSDFLPLDSTMPHTGPFQNLFISLFLEEYLTLLYSPIQ